MKRIVKWLIVLCMIMLMIPVPPVYAAPPEAIFTLTDGKTVSINDYKDDVVMVIWYSAETGENGNAVDRNSASMIRSLSKDTLIDIEGL